MSEEATAQQQQSTSGMWAPYDPPEIGEKLTELEKIGKFVLVEVKVREPVATENGPREPVDLRVQTTQDNLTRLFSGFAKGIVGQAKRVQPGDLPAVCRIVRTNPTGRGETMGLELVDKLASGADLRKIAEALDMPVLPTANAGDDVPF